jgi:hypothetical protein
MKSRWRIVLARGSATTAARQQQLAAQTELCSDTFTDYLSKNLSAGVHTFAQPAGTTAGHFGLWF